MRINRDTSKIREVFRLGGCAASAEARIGDQGRRGEIWVQSSEDSGRLHAWVLPDRTGWAVLGTVQRPKKWAQVRTERQRETRPAAQRHRMPVERCRGRREFH